MFMRRKLSSRYLSRMITRARVEGISRADVSIGAIEVEHDGRVTVAQLRDAIAVAGYTLSDGETNRRSLPVV